MEGVRRGERQRSWALVRWKEARGKMECVEGGAGQQKKEGGAGQRGKEEQVGMKVPTLTSMMSISLDTKATLSSTFSIRTISLISQLDIYTGNRKKKDEEGRKK
jgi:hypothetical protein